MQNSNLHNVDWHVTESGKMPFVNFEVMHPFENDAAFVIEEVVP